jgi:O-antigen/teichoic acid export membrane protein
LKNDLKINKTKIKEILKFSLPIYLSNLINFPLSFIPLYILKKFDSDFVSIFNLSISIAALIYISTTIFESIYIPKWGNYLVNNYHEKIIISYKFITRWNFFVASILFTTFLISQDQIITLLYTVKYIDINKYLYIFLISILLSALTGPSEGIIKVFANTKYIFFSRIISSVLCIILVFILPFYFGKLGIILTYSVSAIIGNLFYSFFIYFKYKIHPFDRSYFVFLLIFILTFLISYLFLPFKNIVSNNIIHVFIIFIIIFCINIIFFLLLRFLMNSLDKNLQLNL